MVTIVVAINLILSALLCYLARRIWQIQRKLARTADTLIAIERCTRSVLRDAPEIIYCGQDSIYRLRQSGEPLQIQLQQLRQVILLSVIGWRTWVRIRNSEYSPKEREASYGIRKTRDRNQESGIRSI